MDEASRALPTAEVSQTGSNVTLAFSQGTATTASMSADFSAAPYSFVVEDVNGNPPIFTTFGSLLHVPGGLITLSQGSCYRIVVAAPAPKTPATRSAGKPPLPPRNGVNNAAVKIPRQALVQKILESNILIIRSPPATGKTSLLDLTEAALGGPGVKVLRLDIVAGMPEKTTTPGLLAHLRDRLEIKENLPEGFKELPEHQDTWILIDDAQLAFQAEGFWQVIINHIENLPRQDRNLHVVIAATYDLVSQGTTPIVFQDYPHLQDLLLSREEAEVLYDGYIENLPFARGWEAFKERLLRLSNGHVGVLTAGIGLLHQEYSNSQKNMTMDKAFQALHGNHFKVRLNRCFPHQTLMNDEQRDTVANTICKGGLTDDEKINTSDNNSDLAQLVRAGILSVDGTFSCLLAQQQYFNYYYQRPHSAPNTITDLILQSVKSMSALRLLQSSLNREFPKEAAFQQLFNEAMTLQLPPHVAVCPELNTFATSASSGEVKTGELDFFIDGGVGEFKWAVELLVNGDKINKHVERFDPENGKYRKVGHSDFIVIDCRRTRARDVKTMAKRCTLYFAPDCKTVECKIGYGASQILNLNE